MTPVTPRRYDRPVAAVRDALRRAAAGLVILIGFFHPAAANAASGSFNLGDQSVVQVLAGARSQVTIKGWDRPNIQFDTDDEAAQVTRRPITFGTAQTPLSISLPVQNIQVRDQATGLTTRGTLPPEEFPYASDFRNGVHDTVRIQTAEDSHLTVMVPATTALLVVRIRNGVGFIDIEDYHGGTLFVGSGGGATRLNDVMSAAFVQMINGRLDVTDSSFDRLRARGNNASFVFEHNRARQIEVSTVSGNIVYDNGTFDPGLARFDSTYGSIGIGVASGAQVSARSTDGHVYSMWDRRTPIEQRGDSDVNATIGGGGPVVNAVTGRGNVYLYDGSLTTRGALPPAWRPIRQAMTQRRSASGGTAPLSGRRPVRSTAFARYAGETKAARSPPLRCRPAPHRGRPASCGGSSRSAAARAVRRRALWTAPPSRAPALRSRGGR